MELQPLTEQEAGQVEELLKRAIANDQLLIYAQYLDANGVDLRDGIGCYGFEFGIASGMANHEKPVDPENEDGDWIAYDIAEIHLSIPDEALAMLNGDLPGLNYEKK